MGGSIMLFSMRLAYFAVLLALIAAAIALPSPTDQVVPEEELLNLRGGKGEAGKGGGHGSHTLQGQNCNMHPTAGQACAPSDLHSPSDCTRCFGNSCLVGHV